MMKKTPSTLTMQVVPHALLEMSRSVLREKFSAVVRKPVFTFYFDRFMNIDAALFQKLKKAREMRAIVIASPTSIKSFMLKFVEMMRHLEHEKNSAEKKGGGIMRTLGFVAQTMNLASRYNEVDAGEAYFCNKVLEIFRTGVMMLDEVDLLLHPLVRAQLAPGPQGPSRLHSLPGSWRRSEMGRAVVPL